MQYYKLKSETQIERVKKVIIDGMKYTNLTPELLERAGVVAYPYTPTPCPTDGQNYTHTYVVTDSTITDVWTPANDGGSDDE